MSVFKFSKFKSPNCGEYSAHRKELVSPRQLDSGSAIETAVAETIIANRVHDRTAAAYRQKLLRLGKSLKVNGGEVGGDIPVWTRPCYWVFSEISFSPGSQIT